MLLRDANLATILAFIVFAISAVVSPWIVTSRNYKRMNKANGGLRDDNINADEYRQYNLYDLALKSLVNSEEAKETAKQAAVEASRAHMAIKKITKHLGIDE